MDREERSDWEIVQSVQAGGMEAFEVLVRRHEKTVFNLLYRWLGSYEEATEAAQDVFLSAYRFIKRFRGESSFSTWLYRIAVNQAKNRRRGLMNSQRRMVELSSADPVADPGQDPVKGVEQREIQGIVHEALGRLEDDDRLVIILHDLQGVSYGEIALALDLPVGTVKSRLHRARLALKARLARYFQPAKAQA